MRIPLLLLVALTLACPRAEPAPEPAPKAKKKRTALQDGRDDYVEKALTEAELDAAVQKAKAEGKRVMLMFGGDWCKWCHALHRLFDDDETVKKVLAERYALIKVDFDSNEALDKKLGEPSKNGFPVLVILDDQGGALHTQETGSLEKKPGVAHDPGLVLSFLQKHARPAS